MKKTVTKAFYIAVRAWLIKIDGVPERVFRGWPVEEPELPMISVGVPERKQKLNQTFGAWDGRLDITIIDVSPDNLDDIEDAILVKLEADLGGMAENWSNEDVRCFSVGELTVSGDDYVQTPEPESMLYITRTLSFPVKYHGR